MKNLVKLIFILFITVLLLLIFEGLARLSIAFNLVQYHKPIEVVTELAENNAAQEDWRLTHAFVDEYFQSDPVLFWRPRAGFGPFNSLGFKGPEPSDLENIPNSDTIIAYGDSNTQGLLTTSWPEEVAKISYAGEKPVDVYNAGVAGYSSYQGLQRFREDIPRIKPTIIIISFGWNDAAPSIGKPDNQYKPYLSSFQSKINSLRIYLIIRYYTDKYTPNRGTTNLEYRPRVNIDEYKQNITEFVALARENNIQTILLTRPHTRLSIGGDELNWRRFIPQYNDALREVAHSLSVPIVDLEEFFESEEGYFLDEAHFTEGGHRRAAEIVVEELSLLKEK